MLLRDRGTLASSLETWRLSFPSVEATGEVLERTHSLANENVMFCLSR